MALTKRERRIRIKMRIRKKISGVGSNPRLSVFRSNTGIYAQLIDDKTGKTIAAADSRDKSLEKVKGNKIDQAKMDGKLIAERAIAKGITAIVFDRGGYLYHGRVKSLAEGAREGGLNF